MFRRVMLGLLLAAAAGVTSARADNVTFCYHQFDHSLGNVYSVLPEVFDWQVQYLRENGIDVISLGEFNRRYFEAKDLGRSALLTVDDGWADVTNAFPVIHSRQVPLALFLYPEVLLNSRAYLKFNQVVALKDDPLVSVGCHSYTHAVLRHVKTARLEHEVADSQAWLEKSLGRKVEDFAYPFGMFDRVSKRAVSKRYRLAFGVDDGPNDIRRDPFNLRRFVVYRTTTLGEFVEMARAADGHAPREYRVTSLGYGRGVSKGFIYVKAELYHYPAEDRPKKVLVIPGSEIGAGWIYKVIDRMAQRGAEVVVMVNRNSHVPFYRPDKDMRSLLAWGLAEYVDDLKQTFDSLELTQHDWAVVTWGDGFDLTAATLARYPEYAARLQGMALLNPSIADPEGASLPAAAAFAAAVAKYDAQLARGEYASQKLNVFLKMKTLSDLMVLNPDAPSPFAKTLGYARATTNKQLLVAEFDQEDHPDLGLDYASNHYTTDDFKTAFLRPLPLFSMVVPLRWVRDIHELWATDFQQPGTGMIHKDALALPVLPIVSPDYEAPLSRIRRAFPRLKWETEKRFEELSTMELLLADSAAEAVCESLGRYLELPPTLTPPEPTPAPSR